MDSTTDIIVNRIYDKKSAINKIQNNVNSTIQRKIREKGLTLNETNLPLSGTDFNLIISVNYLILETV